MSKNYLNPSGQIYAAIQGKLFSKSVILHQSTHWMKKKPIYIVSKCTEDQNICKHFVLNKLKNKCLKKCSLWFIVAPWWYSSCSHWYAVIYLRRTSVTKWRRELYICFYLLPNRLNNCFYIAIYRLFSKYSCKTQKNWCITKHIFLSSRRWALMDHGNNK